MPFYQDELVVIMPNTEFYQEIQKRYKTATWIKNEPVIMREEGSGTRKETEKILRKAGIMPDTLNIVASIENPEAIKRSVKSGPGITIISKHASSAIRVITFGPTLAYTIGSLERRISFGVWS